MKNTVPHIKKHLSFSSLRDLMVDRFSGVSDTRRPSRVSYSVSDTLMSAFAMMYFKDSSLLEYQRRWLSEIDTCNLTNVFKVKNPPGDTQFRKILDATDPDEIKPLFKDFLLRLQRQKYLEDYVFINDSYLVAIDGSEYFSSDKISCSGCLRKKNGENTRYHHQILQSVLIHPDKKQVIPFAPEEVKNSDGTEKQDCELNAAKRLLPKLRDAHPKLKMILTQDGLFSNEKYISLAKTCDMSYILVAKPKDHKKMFEMLQNRQKLNQVHEVEVIDSKNNLHTYRWSNGIKLNGRDDSIRVNFLEYELFNSEKDKITYRNSWVTDIVISEANVRDLVRGGRARWKIENETFNTLKNQGYDIEHNYGHGSDHLSFNFFLLNLLAFFVHQILELSCKLYQEYRQKMVTQYAFWENIQGIFKWALFESWEEILIYMLYPPPARKAFP